MMKRSVFARMLAGAALCALLCMCAVGAMAAFDPSLYPEFTFEVDGSSVKLTEYTGSATEVEIPQGVTAIGADAFYERNLASVILPEGLLTIDERAFFGNYDLQEIDIPSSVVTIGLAAFCGCNLKEVILPEGIKEVSGFNDNEELRSVVIPDGVITIGESAFTSCWSLSEVVIPDSVTLIDDYAFDRCDLLRELSLPANITSIGKCAFDTITKLYTEVCSDTAFALGKAICDRDGNTSYSYYHPEYPLLTFRAQELYGFKHYMVEDCDANAVNVVVPDGVTAIGDEAFSGCSKLTSVVLPDSLKWINYRSFFGCSALTEINIPNSVTSIETGAFSESGLTSVRIPDSVTDLFGAFDNCKSLTSVDLGAVPYIYYTFYGCSALEEIKIPSSVLWISDYAFKDCTNLKKITFAPGIQYIGPAAFENCTALKKITLPDTMIELGDGAFGYCSGLNEVTIPASVTTIGDDLFYSDSGEIKPTIRCYEGSYADTWAQENGHTIVYIEAGAETTMILPASLTVISSESFSGVPVNVIVLPDGCEAIGDKAFANCANLIRVEIPASVTGIAPSAFEGCPADLAIAAPAGSYAETFAQNNGIAFIAE